MRKRLLAIITLLLVAVMVAGVSGCADPDRSPWETGPVDNTYVINKITATYTVNEDSTIEVEERFDVTFLGYHRGIYRDLATNSGERYRNVRVTTPKSSPYFDVNHTDVDVGIIRIALGLSDDDSPIKGDASYGIAYTMIIPETDDMGELYLNLVGFGWTTSVKEVEITLNLPESIENAQFYTKYGSASQSSSVQMSDLGNNSYKITAKSLPAYNGVTIRADYVNGFERASYKDEFPVTAIIIAVVLTTIAVVLFLVSKSGEEITPITNFYPPNNEDGDQMTPVDMGYYIDGSISNEDVASIIFYWASKGYISIDNVDGNDPVLIKNCSIPSVCSKEYKDLFNAVFEDKSAVKISDLTYRLGLPFAKLRLAVSRRAGSLYVKKSIGVAVGVFVLGLIIPLIYCAVKTFAVSATSLDAMLSVIPTSVMTAVAFVLSFILKRYELKNKNYKLLAVLLVVGSLAVTALTSMAVLSDTFSVIETAIVCVPSTLVALSAGHAQKRSSKYKRALGEIVGFKHFLDVAEKERLEMLLLDNPQYYYDILPYANVLGVSSVWEDKFKDITLSPPVYVRGGVMMDYLAFRLLVSNVNSGMRMAVSPKPSSSSRSGGDFSGFSGGGFGGGGFGGGGGGAR